MQPDTKQPQQQPPYDPQDGGAHSPGGPVVSLSPEESQPVETVYPLDESDDQQSAIDYMEPVRWQSTEYIQRDKDGTWFVMLIIIAILLILAAIFIIKSFTFALLIPVMVAALLVYTRRPPRLLDYTLSRQGLHINDRLYPFSAFKSFALVRGADHYSIMLIPTKRFQPAVTIIFPEEAGEAIIDMLAARLPMREVELDLVDKLIQKLRI